MPTRRHSEYLQETLLHLEQARRKESEHRQESDAILNGVSALVGASTHDEVLTILRDTFRSLVGCDDCWVLQPHGDKLVAENGLAFPVHKGFNRVLDGGILNAFDVSRIPEWQDVSAEGICSAMHLPLRLPLMRGMLILTSSKPAAFSHKDTVLAQRIIPLTEQAVAKIEQIEQTHAAQMEEQWQLMRLIMDHAPVGIFMLNKDRKVMFVNNAFCTKVGITEEHFIEVDHYSEVLPDELAQQCMLSDRACFDKDMTTSSRESFTDHEGQRHTFHTTKVPVHDPDGNVYALVGISADITEQLVREREQEQMQQQLQHTQKLESLGVLAGGIAHDFNNILTAIMGHASLGITKCKTDTLAVQQHLTKVVAASEKAADLCKQMLAYSGHGQFIVKPLDVSLFVESIINILEVSLNKGVVLNLSLMDNLPMVEADESQIQQVLMNLITNANEAIENRSGVIAIRTGVMEAGEDYLAHCLRAEDTPPGHFVFIEVSDTGCGMDEKTIDKIFDPFFTTKFTGRGLGMSAVLGIIRGHNGALKLYSEPNRGTTFRVLLPVKDFTYSKEDDADESALRDCGIQRVMIVDDEESVREITSMMLGDAGIEQILTASDGKEAMQLYKHRGNEIDLIILDLTMPHMDGEETFRQLRLINPDVKVILISGYSEQSVQDRFAGKGLRGFLQKPFTSEKLAKVINDSFSLDQDDSEPD